jgi:hypothetical protein
MSDYILKKSQANAARPDTNGIKLKPVTDSTKLMLAGDMSMEDGTTVRSIEHEDIFDTNPTTANYGMGYFNGATRGRSIPLPTNANERWASVEDHAAYSEGDGDDYQYNDDAFRQKKQVTNGDSEMS